MDCRENNIRLSLLVNDTRKENFTQNEPNIIPYFS